MPPLKPYLDKGRSANDVSLLLDAAHEAMVQSFGVLQGDLLPGRIGTLASFLQALDTGLDVPRTEKFDLVEVVSRPRGKQAKVDFPSAPT